MATDATGTPTAKGIPKYDTTNDAPSGLGFNAAMDAIDVVLDSYVPKPSGIAAGEAAVWNGTSFVRSSVTNIGASSLGTGYAPSKLAQEGASTNQVMTWNGTIWAPAAAPGATFVTALPGSPTDGQEIIYTDSLTAPTYQWRLRYVSAKASNKWIFIGGTPLQAINTASNSTTSASYVTLTGDPSITLPIAGDYHIYQNVSGNSTNQTGNRGFSSYSVGATAAADQWCCSFYTDAAPHLGGASRTMVWTGLAASTVIQMKHKVFGGGTPSIGFINRLIQATPIAIGG